MAESVKTMLPERGQKNNFAVVLYQITYSFLFKNFLFPFS